MNKLKNQNLALKQGELTTPLFIMNSSHDIIGVNNAFCKFINLAQKEIVGKKCYHVIHNTNEPSSDCPIYKKEDHIDEDVSVFKAEFYEPWLKKYIRAEIYPLIGNDIYVHTITDLTTVSSSNYTKGLFNEGITETARNLRLPYVVIDKDFKIKEVSQEALKLIKYEGEFRNRRISCGSFKCKKELCPEDILVEVKKKKTIYHDVIRVKTDSDDCYIRRSIVPLIDRDNEVKEMLIVLNDLSGTRKHERMSKTEEFLSSVIEGIGDALVVIDREFRILSANREYLNQIGLGLDMVRGNFCYALTHRYSRPCYKEGEDCPVYKTFLEGKTYKSIHEHKDQNNNVVYVEVVSYPLRDETGKVYAAVETLRDITDVKKIERERMELKIQLLQAQKMEAIGTLAAGIAHDFNNMLMGIAGFAEIIKKKTADREISDYIDRILNITGKASKLTNQILIIGRKVKFKKRRLDINRFVNDSLATIKRMIEEKIVISADLHPNLPAIEADEGQLYQVLLNLVINARDVMQSGGKIVISTGLRDVGGLNKIALKAGKYVYLSVRDTGPGIPEHIKDRIFEPFFTTKPKSKGTGLGLSVVYSIVNEHDGFIEVKTELDKGTEFIVLFPAVNADLDHDGETELCLIKEVDGEGKKVLVAEDEEIIRDLLSICLSEWGFEVLMANNGEEALKIFEKMPDEIDIVILDKVMPQISGLDALKRIKTINPDIKSIICTGYTSPEEVEEIEKVGVSSILKKPFKIEQLKEALIKIV